VTPAELLERAEKAAAAGQRELAAGDPEAAANRLYYAMFHAARAALLSVGEPTASTHATVIGRFGMRFCRNGPLSPELGRAFNKAQELRTESDYGEGSPDRAQVAAFLTEAEQFVAAVKSMIAGGSMVRPG
jgi:uncharacterized protein (UPF0332 family)